tara:strand:+ start:96 stop:287 length:192 start_codon:yes stop_codon:yes gene_type:complete
MHTHLHLTASTDFLAPMLAQTQLATLRQTKIDENRQKVVKRPAKIGNKYLGRISRRQLIPLAS